MKYVLIILTIMHIFICTHARSPHRPIDTLDPFLYAYWTDKPSYKQLLRSSHIEEIIFKIFDRNHFTQNLLPQNPIHFRYDEKSTVTGKTLSMLMEYLLKEINQGKRTFRDFTVLKQKDFALNNTGLIILKYKNYPFVVKLFIETPQSFVNPFDKGFESTCFFYMGGGVSRFINGFTRIKNLEYVKNILGNDPAWHNRVDFPRKWFWVPQACRSLTIEGINIGPSKTISCSFPSTYAIICDYIIWTREFSLANKDDRELAMNLSNRLNMRIDPHINNFGIEQKSGKIVPIDFEHFPTVVGLKTIRTYSGYTEWFSHLSCKMLYDSFCRTKNIRRSIQRSSYCSTI